VRVVIPTNTPDGLMAKRNAHFGRASFYIIVDIENGEIKDVSFVKNPGHQDGACGNAVENIKNLGADALIVSGIGPNPLMGFKKEGIKVYFDDSATVEGSIKKLIEEKLEELDVNSACSHHRY
jgi:predicted Fe-Mo cluster-binding NifX family protein